MTIVNELLGRLEDHPAVRDLRRQDREAASAERRRLVGERNATASAHAKRRPSLAKALDEASAAASRAHAAWRRVAHVALEAEADLTDADHAADVACSRINGELRLTAPSTIADFLGWLDGVLDQVRREPPIHTVVAKLDFGEEARPIGSTYQALQRWVGRACRLREKGEALQVEALDDGELSSRLAGLREELGPIPGPNEAEVLDPAFAKALARQLERLAAAAQ